MPKTFTCQDVGVDCDWKTVGETEDEILAAAPSADRSVDPIATNSTTDSAIIPIIWLMDFIDKSMTSLPSKSCDLIDAPGVCLSLWQLPCQTVRRVARNRFPFSKSSSIAWHRRLFVTFRLQ